MTYHIQRGTSRENGYTPLEKETRDNREEHAAKSPEKIAKAKDRRERRTAKKLLTFELERRFSEAVAGNPEKITIVAINLHQNAVKSHITWPESAWLDKIATQTDTFITRKDSESLVMRGLPADLIQAKIRIQEDMARIVHKPIPVPQ